MGLRLEISPDGRQAARANSRCSSPARANQLVALADHVEAVDEWAKSVSLREAPPAL